MKFAPISTPLYRRLQTLAALVAALIFFACLGLFVWCLFHVWTYPFLAVYLAWILVLDKAPEVCGRRSKWWRTMTIWKWLRNYFPCKLHKTAELDPSKKYIMCYHPHGVISVGLWISFGTEANGVSELFPGITIYPLTIVQNFLIPFWRDFLLLHGLCSVSRKSCDYILSQNDDIKRKGSTSKSEHKLWRSKSKNKKNKKRAHVRPLSIVDNDDPSAVLPDGKAILIVPGGAREALEAKEGTMQLTLNKRKGFVKVALTHGASLVPVLGFGENDIFQQVDNKDGSILRAFQHIFLKFIGIAPCIP